MPKIINPKSFDHWLSLKSEDISSTESAALFGLSPYSSEFELYHEKLSGEIKTNRFTCSLSENVQLL